MSHIMYETRIFGKNTHLTEIDTGILLDSARYEEGFQETGNKDEGSSSSKNMGRRSSSMRKGREEIADVLRIQKREAAGKWEEEDSYRAKCSHVGAMDQ